MVCSLPSFLVGCLLFYLPESPKFLLSRGKYDKAMSVFRGIYVTNTGKPGEEYPVKQLVIDESLRKELEEAGRPIKGKYSKMFWDVCQNSKQLFQYPIVKFTSISITINLTFHIGYYGK